jgi:hypothetical protein
MRAVEMGFHSLSIIPARDPHGAIGHREAADVGVRATTEALSDSGQNASAAAASVA